ncbi:MAG: 50S ribosomal protein L24e [Nanoarchaeota archaeon]
MTKCVFCGAETSFFKGINLIKNVGVVEFYCSRKCKMNSIKLKRDKRKLKWTEAFHITRNKARNKAKEKAAHVQVAD